MTVGEMFAGIGGLAIGFKEAGLDIAWSNEFDRAACITYRANHSHYLIEGDVKSIDPNQLPKVDILTGGFPCQAFSMAGSKKGFADQRGELFFDIIRFLDSLKPRAFLLENVKGLVSHDGGQTFKIVMDELKNLGYTVIYKILKTSDYCQAPQKRERIFLIGFLNPFNSYNFEWPKPAPCTKAWWDILEDNPEDWYDLPMNKHYRHIIKEIKTLEHKTLYTYIFREVGVLVDSIAPTVLCRKDRGECGYFLNKNGILRVFTARERLRLQGFGEDFILPAGVAKSQILKQIGNAVSPPVIALLAKEIKRVLDVEYTSYDLVLK